MPSKKRFLPPPQITRWNYWLYAPPRRPYELQPTLQRNGEYPEEDPWVDLAPGEGAPDQYTKARFKSGLDASPYEALYDLAWDNKLWEQYAPAQEVLKQLAPEDRAKIIELKKARWPERSKRPQRQTKTWSKLFRDIAGDIAVFEKLCDVPLQLDELDEAPRKVYKAYTKQAIWLLGGGRFIPKARHSEYRMPDLFDESENPPLFTLLTPTGRLPSKSIYDVDWLTLSASERRQAKKRTVHWFQHSLRNLREYRNRRPPIPWTSDCEQECRRIHKKLLTAKK